MQEKRDSLTPLVECKSGTATMEQGRGSQKRKSRPTHIDLVIPLLSEDN